MPRIISKISESGNGSGLFHSSNFQTIDCGVPQGSMMVPLLFLFCGNDLTDLTSFQTTLFAADTNLHLFHKYIKTLQTNVQNELDKVDLWMRSNICQ